MINTLKNKKFLPLLITHVFGTLDDNIVKNIFVFLTASALTQGSLYWLAVAFALYGMAFLLTSLYAGQFADKMSKTQMIQRLKLIEVIVMAFTLLSLFMQSRLMMLLSLTAFGFCMSSIRIAKYSLIPELVNTKSLLQANALVKASTFISVILASLLLYGLHVSTRMTVLQVMGFALMLSSIAGYFTALKIPATTATTPKLEVNRNPFSNLKTMTKDVEQAPQMKFYIASVAWYWLIGGVVAFFASAFFKMILGAKSSVLVLAMLIFSCGYVVGALVCPYIVQKKKMKWIIPLCSFGISVFLFDMLLVALSWPVHTSSYDIGAFLMASANAYRLLFDVFMGALCSAMFITPFYPALQQATPADKMGRMFGYLAFVCALAVFGSVLIVISLGILNIPLMGVFTTLGVVNLFFAIYACQLLSFETRQKIFRKILTCLFDIEVSGLENLEIAKKQGVLIIPNHTSYLDALIVSTFISEPITFSLTNEMAGKWWVRFFGNLMDIKSLDPNSPFAVKTMVEELKSNKLCMIFTEAHMPNGNTQMKVYEGPALMAQKADAPVLPIQIKGLEYSAYSRLPGKSWWRLFPKVSIQVLPAEKLTSKKAYATFHEARSHSSNRLYEILAKMRLDAWDLNKTLIDATIDTMHRVGRGKMMMEDTDRKPLKFKHIFLRAFILGNLINKRLPDERTVGIMLPTSNACVLTLLGLQAYGKVPAMLNFSSGPKQVISTCKTVQITKVLTAKKVVLLAKLEPLIEALTAAGIEVIYLEDLRKLLTFKDKLTGIASMFFPRYAYHKNAGFVRPSDPAVILFTSGSEGLPKAVLLSHSNVLSNAYQVTTMFDVWDNDIMLNSLPIFHSFGLTVGTFMPLVIGFKMVSYPTPLHYRVIPEFCSSVRATIFFATDTFLAGYAKCANPYDFNSLRIVGAGAEKLKDETRRTWIEKFGVRVVEGYGATECSPIIAVNTFLRSRIGSVGRLMTGMEYKLKEVPGIKEGKELIVKGPNVMIGYMKNDKPGVLQPPKDGWYDTGDIVHMDEDGYIFIKGRSKRFAKIAGEMVSLLAVEILIAEHFKGFIHGVVSIPDPKKGEQLVLITTCGDITSEKLVDLFKEAGLPELAIPKKIIFTDTPPLLSTGKFDYPTATEFAIKEING